MIKQAPMNKMGRKAVVVMFEMERRKIIDKFGLPDSFLAKPNKKKKKKGMKNAD